MAKVEYHAIRCSSCGLFQVQQVKKTPHFKCTVCRKQQKLLGEYHRGTSKSCREVVQSYNMAQGQGQTAFSMIPAQSVAEPLGSFTEKRKAPRENDGNDSKRPKNSCEESADKSPEQTRAEALNSDDEDYIFGDIASPDLNSSVEDRCSNPSTISGSSGPSSGQPVRSDDDGPKLDSLTMKKAEFDENSDDDNGEIFEGIPSPQKNPDSESSVNDECLTSSKIPNSPNLSSKQPLKIDNETEADEYSDDDDDIFNDIPSPHGRQSKESDSQNHYSTPTVALESSTKSPERLLQQEEKAAADRSSAADEKSQNASYAEGAGGIDTKTRLMIQPTVQKKTSVENSRDAVDPEESKPHPGPQVEKEAKVREAWRRRSIDKLAKFKFDPEDDSIEDGGAKISSALLVPESRKNEAPPKTNVIQDKAEECQAQGEDQSRSVGTSATKTKLFGDTTGESSPKSVGGRGRFLETLQKFKRAPKGKRKC